MPSRAAKRALQRRGTEVDIINKTRNASGDDKYHDDYNDDPYSGNPVNARIERRSAATNDRSQLSADVQADADVFVPDDVTGLTGGGGDDATRVDVDRDGTPEYRALVVDDQGNGIIRLVCEEVS